jgi:hypothetical protein
MRRIVGLLWLAAIFQACTIKIQKLKDFDPTSPVVVEKTDVGKVYKQNGEWLNAQTMADHFSDSSATRDVVRFHSMYMITGVSLGAAGGALLGYNLGIALAGRKVNYGTVGVGVLAATGGIALGNEADKKLSKAVEIHNRSFEKPQAASYLFRVLALSF